MKTEDQIKRKFLVVKKERENAFAKLHQVHAGERMPNNKEVAIRNYNELIEKQNGFLEALNWVRK